MTVFMKDPKDIKLAAAQSLKWSALSEVISRAVPPIVTVALAHLLIPKDFGIVSTAMIVIALSQVFWDAGLAKALVQRRQWSDSVANVVFWTNLALSVSIYVLLFLTAPFVASFFNSPFSVAVIRVLGILLIIDSVSSVQQALLVRDLGFRQLFWIKLPTSLASGLVSITMALFGHGLWALVAGSLTASVVNLAMLWRMSKWRPILQYDREIAKDLFNFGAWVLAESLAGWFFTWGDSVFVGRFLSLDDLGTYRVGWSVLNACFGLITSPFSMVLFPTFSKLLQDPPALTDAFHKAGKLGCALSFPLGIAFLLLGPTISSLLFGEKWPALGLILSVMGFMYGFMGFLTANAEIYRAIHRPDMNAKIQFSLLILYFPVYLLTCPMGLEAFVYGRMALGFIALFIHIYVAVRLLQLPPLYAWHNTKSILLSALTMAVLIHSLEMLSPVVAPQFPSTFFFLLVLMAGGITYAAMLRLIDRDFFFEVSHGLKKAILT